MESYRPAPMGEMLAAERGEGEPVVVIGQGLGSVAQAVAVVAPAASSMLENTGPGWNSNSSLWPLYTVTPSTSLAAILSRPAATAGSLAVINRDDSTRQQPEADCWDFGWAAAGNIPAPLGRSAYCRWISDLGKLVSGSRHEP
jgi:hypothetical protein